jgi:ribose transport system permease protein
MSAEIKNENRLKTGSVLQRLQSLGSLIALVGLVVVFSIISTDFRSVNNILALLKQASVNGLIAFGMTGVILTGGIDLSVGSTLALTSMLCAAMIHGGVPPVVAMLAVLVLGVLFGALSGTLITKGRLQPFIATLITMTVFRGLTMIFSGGMPISNLGNNPFLVGIGKGTLLLVPVPVWIMLVMFALFFFVLNKTTFGRRVYATGSNEKAAKLAGVNVNKTKILVYIVSGVTATLAGLILLSRLGSAQPTIGTGYEMDAIAAVVLGGTSMSGGRGKIYGTLVGVIIIAVLNNGLNIMNVSSYYQDVVKGLVILLAVLSDRKR